MKTMKPGFSPIMTTTSRGGGQTNTNRTAFSCYDIRERLMKKNPRAPLLFSSRVILSWVLVGLALPVFLPASGLALEADLGAGATGQVVTNMGTVRTSDGKTLQGNLHLAAGGVVEIESTNGPAIKIGLDQLVSLRLDSTCSGDPIVLSINSRGRSTPMDKSEVAGVVPAACWNNFTKQRNSGELLDNRAQPSGVTYRFSGENFDDHLNPAIPDRPGDFRMMRGFYDQTHGMIHRIADIPFARYDLYVYFDRFDDPNCRSFNHKFWITGGGGGNVLAGPVYGQDRHRANFSGRFIEVPLASTNDSQTTPAGNYFHFTNLTASTINVMAGDGNSSWGESGFSRSCVNGIQVVATAGPGEGGIRHGLVLRDGNAVAGAIRSADEASVQFIGDHGAEATVPTPKVARLAFAPVFPDLERGLHPHKTGLLLRGEDFMEADFKGLRDGKVRFTSLLFGPKTFDVTRQELVAVILAPVAPAAARFRVKTRDGGILLTDSVEFGKDELRVRNPALGTLRFALVDLVEIERPSQSQPVSDRNSQTRPKSNQ
jgi:hypothetical protein